MAMVIPDIWDMIFKEIYIFEISLNSKTEGNQFTLGETFYVAYILNKIL